MLGFDVFNTLIYGLLNLWVILVLFGFNKKFLGCSDTLVAKNFRKVAATFLQQSQISWQNADEV